MAIAQVRFSYLRGFWDWQVFRQAGSLVGTSHLIGSGFVYTPAVAWLFAPVANLPAAVGFAINGAFMIAASIAAGFAAARIYGLAPWFAVLCVFAWSPTLCSIVIGQNAPLGLLLTLVAVLGLVRSRPVLTGSAVGLLLYKPTYGLPFLVLLIVRREWKAAGVALLWSALWYVASAGATRDWLWPIPYVHALHTYYAADFAGNAIKALNVPELLMRAGISVVIAWTVAVALFAVSLPMLARVPAREGASLMPLVALATSPHAWTYDAVLALPAIFWAMTTLQEPWRTRIVAAAYAIAASWLATNWLRFDPLCAIAIGGFALWLIHALHEPVHASAPRESDERLNAG